MDGGTALSANSTTKVIQALCPHCENPVKGPNNLYGQQSYECSHCNRFGPWKRRKTRRIIRTPL